VTRDKTHEQDDILMMRGAEAELGTYYNTEGIDT
jgi:hypothetical protein